MYQNRSAKEKLQKDREKVEQPRRQSLNMRDNNSVVGTSSSTTPLPVVNAHNRKQSFDKDLA